MLYGSGVDLMTQDNRPGVGCPVCHFLIHGKTIHEALVVWNRRAGQGESAPSASTNTGSPKLPEWDEVRNSYLAYLSDKGQYMMPIGMDSVRWVYEFIVRQLRAGA